MRVLFVFVGLFFALSSFAQEKVDQVVIANGGFFESMPPYADFATVSLYNPNLDKYEVIDTIMVQSIQDIRVNDSVAYVAAEDSILLYNLATKSKIAQAHVPGIRSMAVENNHLVVSKGFGAVSNYVEVRSAADLSLTFNPDTINDWAEGIVISNNMAYVAVPGSAWPPEPGKIAVIDLNNQTFSHYVELDTLGKGIGQLFTSGNFVYSVNSIGFGAAYAGVTRYDIAQDTAQSYRVETGYYAGATMIADTVILPISGTGYLRYNVNQAQEIDTLHIPIAMVKTAYHAENQLFYITESDYTTYGRLWIYAQNGQMLDSVTIGISPEGIGLSIMAGNQRPFALPDTFRLGINQTDTLDPLGNDFDPNGDGFTINLIQAPVQGPSSVTATDKVEFTSFTDYSGIDGFQYSICDNGNPGLCDTARAFIQVGPPSGVETMWTNPGFLVYPNPASDYLHVLDVNGQQLQMARIYNLSGQVVAQQELNPTTQQSISVQHLAQGSYIVELIASNSIARLHFVKQ